MSTDVSNIFFWWLTFFLVGVVSFPLTHLLFKKFTDLGYAFSKVVGLLITSYAIFVLGVLKVVTFSRLSILLILTIFVFFNLKICLRHKKAIKKKLKSRWKIIIFQEILFTSGLIFWSWVRAHQPDINGLEKLMDFGFINSVLRSKYLPPGDMWFSGSPINYYWFGHFFVAFLTKLSGIPSNVTYNLMLATILGFCLTFTFSISSTLASLIKPKINSKTIFFAGFISAILISFAGNFHTPYYIFKEGKDKYWYPDATRFIGYNPDVNDKTIHEFPIYSFVVSDLHAHLINFPFVLLYIAFLLNYVLIDNPKRRNSKFEILNSKQYLNYNSSNHKQFNRLKFKIWNLFRVSKFEIRVFEILPLGFLLGVFFMTSTWDFGNYFLLTGIAFTIVCFKREKFNFSAYINVGILILLILAISVATALPFIASFESIAQGIKFVHSHSPLWQLAILWGFPALLTIIFFTTMFIKFKKLIVSDIFVFSLLTTSWLLILLPEIVYVKDIYIASHYRANTMFKLTYQAFVMSYLSSGYVVVRCLSLIKKVLPKIVLGLIFSAAISSVLTYPKIAINSYYNKLKDYKGLSGESWVMNAHPDVYNVILWFRKNINGQPVILEAPGDSYTEYNLISSYTGLPTVSGWFVHEWLWRGDSSFPQGRVADITQIYTSDDIAQSKSLLAKYNVTYVIIGENEREKFPNINEKKFEQLGKSVFKSGSTNIIKLN